MKNEKMTIKSSLSKPFTANCRFEEISASKKKLNAKDSLGFAEKTPKLVVRGRHTIVYEK